MYLVQFLDGRAAGLRRLELNGVRKAKSEPVADAAPPGTGSHEKDGVVVRQWPSAGLTRRNRAEWSRSSWPAATSCSNPWRALSRAGTVMPS